MFGMTQHIGIYSIAGLLSLVIWLYLLLGRGFFWCSNIRNEWETLPAIKNWPSVAIVIPARNEADVIAESLTSHFAHDYPVPPLVVLVDDQSTDGTETVAYAVAEMAHVEERLKIIKGQPLPAGWTGKLWAMEQGISYVNALPQKSDYILLTDADIAYSPQLLKRLVNRAQTSSLSLVSLMVKLRCESFAERALIPAFIFFFQMLYPFAWVNRKSNKIGAAAGGCMLVDREALQKAGGIAVIKSSLIDDCALGRKMKQVGLVWLGLTDEALSLRPYPNLQDIRKMVARSAYDQLNYSPLRLTGTIIGMILVYLVPPILALFTTDISHYIGLGIWTLMTLMFLPTVRFYRLSWLWALALPVIASFYMFFTFDSAYQHWRGKGGMWKGRVQAQRAEV